MGTVRALLLSSLLIVTGAWGESTAEQCIDGQWVLSVSAIGSKQEMALEALEGVSAKPLEVVESSAKAILVAESGNDSSTDEVNEDEIVDYETHEDLCRKLRKQGRALRRASDGIVRRYNCSCNGVIKLTATPNDPMYYLTWGLNDPAYSDIDAPAAWDRNQGDSNLAVAVIDTGVDYNHPDLAANMWVNALEVPANGTDDDGNGYIDDIHGINAINLTGNPMDDQGHGTHVAGTIAARGNNGVGLVGVNWQSRIIAVKFLGSSGSGTLYDAIVGIDYVTALKNRGENIVLSNNSWGCNCNFSPMYDAILRAQNAGLLFVAAAGNNGVSNETTPHYPSSFSLDNIISVAASGYYGALTSFSNYGTVSVDLAAPGYRIASTYPGGGYVYLSGTSMASPHVAGALALLKSHAPHLTWQELRSTLLDSVVKVTSLTDKVASGGLLNVNNMLINSPPLSPDRPAPTPYLTPTPKPSNTIAPTPTPMPTATPILTPTKTPTPMPAYYDIQGTVTLNGTGLAGVKIVLKSSNVEVVRYTDSNGAYRFDRVLGPTNVSLTAFKGGYVIAPYSEYLNGHKNINLTAEAQSHTLSVQVIDAQKATLSGVSVDGGALGTATTDAQGIASFGVVYGMNYSLSASLSGHKMDRGTLSGTILGDVTRVIVAVPQ